MRLRLVISSVSSRRLLSPDCWLSRRRAPSFHSPANIAPSSKNTSPFLSALSAASADACVRKRTKGKSCPRVPMWHTSTSPKAAIRFLSSTRLVRSHVPNVISMVVFPPSRCASSSGILRAQKWCSLNKTCGNGRWAWRAPRARWPLCWQRPARYQRVEEPSTHVPPSKCGCRQCRPL